RKSAKMPRKSKKGDIMHIKYHPDIDALYIGLNERVKSKTRQITDSIVLDFDVDDKANWY
ncbi:MAG: DUF2283 domain-containing protein, partial [Anaerolineae bacterium]|nr:DUF2283 domain-containing protein [Anaerolineae bacterium]